MRMFQLADRQSQLRRELEKRGVARERIESLIESGYVAIKMSTYGAEKSALYIQDTFYGSKQYSGRMLLERFLEGDTPKALSPEYEVSSLHDIKKILNSRRHKQFATCGRLCFRGQTKEYTIRRSAPNPCQDRTDGERLILPGYWRQFRDRWLDRFSNDPPRSIFQTVDGDELIYHGIPEWKTLSARNAERYGIHTMSDLEDFPYLESREYGRRWRMFKVEGGMRRDLPLVEQHYGIDTNGLDVTFNINVAAFFAANKFYTRSDGTSSYQLVEDGKHTGVIYGFVFESPALTRTSELVTEIPLFAHLTPTRPLRQACALPFFHATGINEAVCDLDFVMYLTRNFDPSGIRKANRLFPSTKRDAFYRAAMDAKIKYPGIDPFKKFVEYAF